MSYSKNWKTQMVYGNFERCIKNSVSLICLLGYRIRYADCCNARHYKENSKTPSKEIAKAEKLKEIYFNNKKQKKGK